MPGNLTPISPQDQVLFVGSCFAENIGSELASRKFNCSVNPFGVLYNPASIRLCFQELRKEIRTEDFLFETESGWHSWLHDSHFDHPDRNTCLDMLSGICQDTLERLKKGHTLFLTLGTNHVYRLKDRRLIVGNCHKQPGRMFDEYALDTEACAEELKTIVNLCLDMNPNLRIVWTVSPYRYAKYGFHESQLSKATLLLAVDRICRQYPDHCCYFPAYEIVLDELRDYRFYKEDMLHPSEQAVRYIWECFQQTFLTPATRDFIREWEEIRRAMEHRPARPESAAYRSFLSKTLLKLESIRKKYPNLALSYEFDWLSSRLNTD